MLTLATACLLLVPAPAAAPDGGEWLTDFEKAKAAAKAQGKDLLIDFTGSDWCHWCIKLKEEVFDTDAFNAAVGEHFILVELDFPRTKELPAELRKQNEELQQRFAIQGFPTVILADADGKPYGKTGYQPGGPAAYMPHLETLRGAHTARDTAWKKAADAQGADRAKLLAEGLDALSAELYAHYTEVIGEIVKLDADGGAGLHGQWSAELAKIEAAAAMQEILASAQELAQAGDWAAVAKQVGAFLAAHEVDGQEGLMVLSIQLKALEETKDFDGAIAVLGKIKKLAPHAAERVDQMVAEFEKQKAEAEKAEAEKAKAEKVKAEKVKAGDGK